MHKWWKNEISGKRCATNIIHNAGVTMGGVSGANTGIFWGNLFFGAPGAVVEAFSGAYFGSMSAENQMDHLIYDIFNLPQSEAVEKAYHFFGLDSGASISEIINAYLLKATVFNPLNRASGDAEKYFEVQVHMQILRMAKN